MKLQKTPEVALKRGLVVNTQNGGRNGMKLFIDKGKDMVIKAVLQPNETIGVIIGQTFHIMPFH